MSYTVTLRSGLTGVALPNGISYDGGAVVVLSDGEYGLISPEAQAALFSAASFSGGGGSGTVTSVSVATANGFAGTVANPGTTPAVTVSTTVTGLLKGSGTAVSAAAAGTDYLAPAGSGAALTGITAAQVGADASGLAAAVLATSAQKSANLSDLASAATARTNLGLAAQQVSAPSGSYAAAYGDQVQVALGTTTGIVLPAPSGAGVETVSATAVSGTGTATVTVTGAGALSAAVSPTVSPVLSSPLATGSPITSLPVNALPTAIAAGTVTIIQLSGGSFTQVFATAGAAAGATSIPVTSVTPNFAYPVTSPMAAAASVTSLPVSALPAAIAAGSVIVTAGTVSQVFTTAGAAQGATSIPVTAATPSAYFPAGSAVAGSGQVLSGYYGLSASIPVQANDSLVFRAFGSVWGYTPPAAAATLNAGAPGSSPSNPVMYAPVKWAFINYNTSVLFLGNAYIYSYAGNGGVGDTVTAGSNGILSIDSGSPSVGDRVLVCDPYAHGAGQPPHPDGIYTVTSVGSAGSPWVLTRSADCNTIAALFQYWAVTITSGSLFQGGYAVVCALSDISGVQNYLPGSTFIRLAVANLGSYAFGPSNTAVSPSNTPQQGFSAAIGTQTTASGSGSLAVGNTATASGRYSHAYGFSSSAAGQQAHSYGSFTQAAGFQATAIGTASSGGTDNSIAQASGDIATIGDAQQFTVFVYGKTTTATPLALASSLNKAIKLVQYQGTANYQKTLLAAFTIVARRTDVPGTDSVWTCQGVLRGSGAPSNTTVAAGSNGGQISLVASWATPGAGILAVASTAGYPSAGTLNVAASGSTTAVVTYTGISGNTFTGCVYVSGSPSGTVATGGTVSLVTAYSWIGGTAPSPAVVAQDSGASAWAAVITVATNVITVTVTGAAGATIVWNAQVSITEVSG